MGLFTEQINTLLAMEAWGYTGGGGTTPPAIAEEQMGLTGDSLEGRNETESNPEGGYYSQYRYSIIARNLMPAGYYGDWTARGRSGYTLDQLLAIKSTVLAGRNTTTWAKGTMGVGGGINNFLFTSDTAQQVFDKRVALIEAAYEFGWDKVVVSTLTRAYVNGSDIPTLYANLDAFNDFQRAYAAANPGKVILADYAKDAQLNDPGDSLRTGAVHNYGDAIHFADPGELLKGRILKNATLAHRMGVATPVGVTPVLGAYNATDKTITVSSPYPASALLLSTNGGVYLSMSSKVITTDGASHPAGYYKVIAGTTDGYNCSAIASSAEIVIGVTPPPTPAPQTVESTDPMLFVSPNWLTADRAQDSGGTHLQSTGDGVVGITFKGEIDLYLPQYADQDIKHEYWLDDDIIDLVMLSGETQNTQVRRTFAPLPADEFHHLRVVARDTYLPARGVFDKAVVRGSVVAYSGNTATPAPPKIFLPGIHEENEPAITYTPDNVFAKNIANGLESGGFCAFTTTKGATVDYYIYGSGVDLSTPHYQTYEDNYDVSVDGGPETKVFKSGNDASEPFSVRYSNRSLTPGLHHVVHTCQGFMFLDRITVFA